MASAPPGYTWCGRKGDLTIYLTHVKFPGDHDEHGALYLRNENRTSKDGGCPAFLVPLRDLWEFRPEDRDRGRFNSYFQMEQQLANACIALYGFDVPAYRHRIHDALLEFADDVKNLAPPPAMTQAEWIKQLQAHRVQLKVDGQRVI
jgi:hypothetical protein